MATGRPLAVAGSTWKSNLLFSALVSWFLFFWPPTGCPLWCPCAGLAQRGSGVPSCVGASSLHAAPGPPRGQPPLPSLAGAPVVGQGLFTGLKLSSCHIALHQLGVALIGRTKVMLWNTKPGMTFGKRRRTQNGPLGPPDPTSTSEPQPTT